MKYTVFFITALVFLMFRFWTASGGWRYAMLWPAVTMAVMATAYARNIPWLICGKRCDGRISLILTLVNLPWLSLTWLSVGVLAAVSREPAVSRIGDTNIHLGRYPLSQTVVSEFDVIVDLTAEFPRWYKPRAFYVCHPNVDGMPLANADLPCAITNTDKVLIHCAQGHGRSATYAALLLGSLPAFASPMSALAMIQESRPLARPSVRQLRQLEAS